MGYGRSGSPASSLPPLDTNGFPAPQRSMTANSNGSQWQRGTPPPIRNGPPSRQMTQDSSSDPRGPPSRQMTQNMYSSDAWGPPSRYMSPDSYSDPRGPPSRQLTQDGYSASPISYNESGRNSPRPQPNSLDTYGRPLPRAVDELSGRTTPGGASVGRRTPFTETSPGGRSSPVPGLEMGRSSPAPSTQISSAILTGPDHDSSTSETGRRLPINTNGQPSSSSGSGGYTPFNPTMRSASAGIASPAPTFHSQQQRPYRNMTAPLPAPSRQPTVDYFDNAQPPRQGTPQSQRGGYNDQYNAYPRAGSNARVASPAGFNGRPGPPPQ